jgi:hypothetical protein
MSRTNPLTKSKRYIIVRILTLLQEMVIPLSHYWDIAYLQILRNRGAHIEGNVFAQHFSTEENFAKLLYIEEGVIFASGVRVILHDSALNNLYGIPVKFGKVIIRRKAYIGARSTILPGVEIGEKAIIGAGSLVTKNVPAGRVAYGVPARIVDTTENLKSRLLEDIKQNPNLSNPRFHYLDVLPLAKSRPAIPAGKYLKNMTILLIA